MSGRVLVVLMVVVTTPVPLLTVTEAIVLGPEPPTYAPDLGNCSESVKLVPVLRLVTPASTSSSPTSTTLPQPHTTTQPLLYTQPHGTTLPTTHTTTTQHPQQPTPPTPTPFKTEKTTLAPKKHTTLHWKLRATQYLEKHNSGKLDKMYHSLNTAKNKSQLFSKSPESVSLPASSSSSSSFSSSSSSTSPPAPSPPVHITMPRPSLPPHTSTLPPPSPALPLPTAPSLSSTTPTVMFTLQEAGENLKRLLGQQIPLALRSRWAKEFQRPYLQRIRAVNHEMVDKILQAEYEEYEPTTLHGNASTCYLSENRLAHLYQRQTLLLLLLQALPQSLEEIEEAARNPEITDYFFRPEKKAVFDMHGCRECYALDASGVCREVFFCKEGKNVFSMTSGRRRIVG